MLLAEDPVMPQNAPQWLLAAVSAAVTVVSALLWAREKWRNLQNTNEAQRLAIEAERRKQWAEEERSQRNALAEDIKRHVDTLQAEQDAQKKEIAALREEHRHCHDELAQVRADNKSMQDQLTQLKAENRSLRSSVGRSRKRLDGVTDRLGIESEAPEETDEEG